MLIWFKVIWRKIYAYAQDALTATLFLSVVSFISQDKLSVNFIWLLWCWLLINSGQHFWHSDVQNRCIDYWITHKKAIQIINNKWLSNILFSCIFWLITWFIWWIIFDLKISLSFLVITTLITIPTILGASVLISSLSIELITNSNLLSFVTLPLLIPVLIYGSSIFVHLARNEDPSHIIAGLIAIALVSIFYVPKLSFKIIKQACRY